MPWYPTHWGKGIIAMWSTHEQHHETWTSGCHLPSGLADTGWHPSFGFGVFQRMPPSAHQAKSWHGVVRLTCKGRHCHLSWQKRWKLLPCCWFFFYFGLMFDDTLVLHGVCGLQTMCPQYISLAKMGCHFGSRIRTLILQDQRLSKPTLHSLLILRWPLRQPRRCQFASSSTWTFAG